ncbi:hypothetical protein K523DRAFT_69536 [Schizophyllum commune Tattone D]|nr:hypothetical protein K523DRAFT_69536 [Schizophyllum commune Tattone D]
MYSADRRSVRTQPKDARLASFSRTLHPSFGPSMGIQALVSAPLSSTVTMLLINHVPRFSPAVSVSRLGLVPGQTAPFCL